MAACIPFLTFHAIFLHANVPWSFGPMRYVVSSPVFGIQGHPVPRGLFAQLAYPFRRT